MGGAKWRKNAPFPLPEQRKLKQKQKRGGEGDGGQVFPLSGEDHKRAPLGREKKANATEESCPNSCIPVGKGGRGGGEKRAKKGK